MRVTVCQLDPGPDSLAPTMEALADHVGRTGSDLLLLPEMSFSEWLAAGLPPSPGDWNRAIAQHEAWIGRLEDLGVPSVVGTRPIVDGTGSRRNEAYLWTTAAPVATPIRQKYYLPDEAGYWEQSWYDRGPRRFETARAGDAVVGVQICTEMWFLEWSRHYAAEQVEALLIPRATPRDSTDKWLAGGRAAAVCSGAYCLSSNLFMPPGSSSAECGGVGWIIDPEGSVLATTSQESPFATVEIDLEFARASKLTYPRYVPE